jgi:hypothetical protein
VKRITDNKWGLSADGKTITGPEGFTIDVSKCAAGWNNVEGLTDTDIKIGQAMAQSGTLAIYGQIGEGITIHFDNLNKAGGIKDSTGKTRKITYIIKDDGYDAARTIPLVDELIDSEKVFIMWTLGSPNTLATYDKLNQRCIPQPFPATSHPAGDLVNHPWTPVSSSPQHRSGAWGLHRAAPTELSVPGQDHRGRIGDQQRLGAAHDGGF